MRTYVQSGNIVLGATGKAADVEQAVSKLISERFGFDVPVIARATPWATSPTTTSAMW